VTGATGFIASYLIPFLVQSGWRVTAAVRCQPLPASRFVTVTSTVVGDIHGTTDWQDALKNIDTVIHLAARAHLLQASRGDEAEFFQVNADGTANLVEQSIAAGVKHFVLVSSIGTMTAQSNSPLTEGSTCQPRTAYGRSKLQAERFLVDLTSKGTMSWTILRPPLVYGLGNPGNMQRLGQLVQQGLPLPLGLVKNRRSLIYVGNLIDAIATILNHPNAANRMFLVSDSQDVSTPELVRKLAHYLNCPCHLIPIPPAWLKVAGSLGDAVQQRVQRSLPINTQTINSLVESLWVDSSYIQKMLDWSPPFSLDQGLFETFRRPEPQNLGPAARGKYTGSR